MELVDTLYLINKNLISVARDTNILVPVKQVEQPFQLRLVDTPYKITDKTARFSKVVSAHKLEQYRPPFYSIHLQEGLNCWIDILLKIDLAEVK